MAAVCGLVGVASVASLATAPAQTSLYAPAAVRPVVASQVAAPVAQFNTRVARAATQQAEVQAQYEAVDAVEPMTVATAAPTTPKAALLGLLAIPVGLFAIFMRKSPAAAEADVEGGFQPAAAAAGLMAAGAAAQPAMAAQEVAQVAVDGRFGAVAALLVPAVGWVGFNVLSAAVRQLDEMQEVADKKGPVGRKAPVPKRGRR